MITMIASILTLVGLLLKEYFLAKSEAKQKQKQFELDQKIFEELIGKALIKQRKSMAKDSQGAGKGWDSADKDR